MHNAGEGRGGAREPLEDRGEAHELSASERRGHHGLHFDVHRLGSEGQAFERPERLLLAQPMADEVRGGVVEEAGQIGRVSSELGEKPPEK